MKVVLSIKPEFAFKIVEEIKRYLIDYKKETE